MSLYADTVPQLIKMLGNLSRWLDDAEAVAKERDFHPDRFLELRLYADMFPLVRQIQGACDAAKFIGSRLAGVEAPKHEDTETTLAEIRERIAATQSFLEGLDPADFEAAADRELFLSFLKGGSITGAEYARAFGLPNFYFHLVTAYDILRHNGVKLGKRSFIGAMDVKQPTS